ncbi:hypothetical protein [Rossellomorea marisflavi]|uniref:hypothetical protein n=1 Tax=Rossellomorea marisflavi TaxID=189381 RepID=UPI00064E9C46|nr:hypothetical protein [Rossellomorea marisflavi]KMK95108.1 hypothetical protein VL03_10095 [Rossellomorea marisflavi]
MTQIWKVIALLLLIFVCGAVALYAWPEFILYLMLIIGTLVTLTLTNVMRVSFNWLMLFIGSTLLYYGLYITLFYVWAII